MKYYPTSQMIVDLHVMLPDIPNAAERNFIEQMYGTYGEISIAQYNWILDLYNKYIAIPAATPSFKHDGTHRA